MGQPTGISRLFRKSICCRLISMNDAVYIRWSSWAIAWGKVHHPTRARLFSTIAIDGMRITIPKPTFIISQGIGTDQMLPIMSQLAQPIDPITTSSAADFRRNKSPNPRKQKSSAGNAKGFRSRPPKEAVCQFAKISKTQIIAKSISKQPIILRVHISMTSTGLLHIGRSKDVRV
jgi:hypothetical protein